MDIKKERKRLILEKQVNLLKELVVLDDMLDESLSDDESSSIDESHHIPDDSSMDELTPEDWDRIVDEVYNPTDLFPNLEDGLDDDEIKQLREL